MRSLSSQNQVNVTSPLIKLKLTMYLRFCRKIRASNDKMYKMMTYNSTSKIDLQFLFIKQIDYYIRGVITYSLACYEPIFIGA